MLRETNVTNPVELEPLPTPKKPVAMLAGLAVLAALLVGAALFFDDPGGTGRAHQALPGKPATVIVNGLVQVRDPTPRISRALPADGSLTEGEFLILRARISSPAFLYLLAQRPGSASEPLWPPTAELHSSGEFELDEGDNPFAIDPHVFGAGAGLIFLACPEPLTSQEQRARVALSSAEAVKKLFPSCNGAVLHVAFRESK
jgi:hypothetical protein